ncbi:MAG TPA: hypothetical protein VGX70_14970 [Gemmataceae bacterium]|jgi:hypothetical protein|nr:hypothetical protein [Gemmataceae bacterium]
MSYAAEQHDTGQKRWFQKKKLWLLSAIAVLLGAGLIILMNAGWSPIPDVGGGLIIEADPGTRIYVGDKLVGTTSVAFTWGELFGDQRHSAIALELSDEDQPITADMLSGPDATMLSQPSGMAIAGTANVKVTQQSAHLIRRADGAIDPVFALILEWFPPNEASGSYVLPVRLRKGPGPSAIYFDSGPVSTTGVPPPRFMRIFGRSPNETKTKCSFTAANPPSQFAEEIQTKGLWEPSGGK